MSIEEEISPVAVTSSLLDDLLVRDADARERYMEHQKSLINWEVVNRSMLFIAEREYRLTHDHKKAFEAAQKYLRQYTGVEMPQEVMWQIRYLSD